jgi:hypothetical protein
MDGISMKNLRMFRELCGNNALQNVVIVTNRWGEVDPRFGELLEAQLARDDAFFKPVLDQGAQMTRHEDTVPSAERIIRLILKNHPLPSGIKEELVTETYAGEELNRELNAQTWKQEQEKQVLIEGMQEVIREKDEETRRKLEIETHRMNIEIERLESNHKGEKERLDARIQEVETEAKEAKCIAALYRQWIDELKERSKNNVRIRMDIMQLETKVTLRLARPQQQRDDAEKTIAFVFHRVRLGHSRYLRLTPSPWFLIDPRQSVDN